MRIPKEIQERINLLFKTNSEMKEKLYCVFNISSINIEESQIVSFQKIEKEEK